MATKKEVAKVEKGGDVAVFDYGEDAGRGFEDTERSELAVPFLGILQALSPQVVNKDPKGAEAGMLFNTVTREITPGEEGVILLPCYKEGPLWVEWVPRKLGGGFVAIHDPNSEVVKKAEPIMHPETGKPTRKLRHGENELIETFYVYNLVLDAKGQDTEGFAVVSFTSTKLKVYRAWTTAIYTLRVEMANGRKVNPPIFANRSRFTTVLEQNKAGDQYYNFRIHPFGESWKSSVLRPEDEADRALMIEAKEFLEMVESGMARAAFETERATVGSDGDVEGSGEGKAPF